MTKKKKRILHDHQQKGKEFQPPFIAMFGDKGLRIIMWAENLLPEFFWLGVLHDSLGDHKAIQVIEEFMGIMNSLNKSNIETPWTQTSSYELLKEEDMATVRKALSQSTIRAEFYEALEPLVSLYPDCPLRKIYPTDYFEKPMKMSVEASIGKLKRVVSDMFDRRSKKAMIVQVSVVYALIVGNQMKVTEDMVDVYKNLNCILEYPNTEESKLLAGTVRAQLNTFPGKIEEGKWNWYFWRQGYKISQCEFYEIEKIKTEEKSGQEDVTTEKKKHVPDLKMLIGVCEQYEDAVIQTVMDIWNRVDIDLSFPERYEVLGGLVTRQVRLTNILLSGSGFWVDDIARIFMRCMADTFIVFAWLLKKGTRKDFEKFVEYGLGQEKLLAEHLLDHAEKIEGMKEFYTKSAEQIKNWIETQVMSDFVSVDVGGWSEKSIREMAIEAEVQKVYSLIYAPQSSVVHGMWNTLERMNLQNCMNPLHRFHRVPNFDLPKIRPSAMLVAVEQMNRLLVYWMEHEKIEGIKNDGMKNFEKQYYEVFYGPDDPPGDTGAQKEE